MKYFLLVFGWFILFAVIISNRFMQPMSDLFIILLCAVSAICLCAGILVKKNIIERK